jgi:hypothetical protein
MATFTWAFFGSTGPAWTSIAANTVVFSGSLTDLTAAITVADYNDGTHIGDNDPGTDQCGANHANNVKFLTTGTMSVNGGGSEAINDTNLLQDECTIRIQFNDAASVSTSSGRFYTFDASVVTNEAVGVDAYAFEQGVTATAWTQVNDDTGNIGGDNTGERLDLGDQGAATDHFFYLAVSASPETVGAKSSFDFGCALVYS